MRKAISGAPHCSFCEFKPMVAHFEGRKPVPTPAHARCAALVMRIKGVQTRTSQFGAFLNEQSEKWSTTLHVLQLETKKAIEKRFDTVLFAFDACTAFSQHPRMCFTWIVGRLSSHLGRILGVPANCRNRISCPIKSNGLCCFWKRATR